MRPKQANPMTIDLEVQNIESFAEVPSKQEFEQWAEAALRELAAPELVIRLVGNNESRSLNSRYRNIDKATNVLSFSVDLPPEIELCLLGDIVICAPLVASEAAAQGKSLKSHWAHLTIHGVLHLLGYDHLDDEEAGQMEALEIEILDGLGFPNPYT